MAKSVAFTPKAAAELKRIRQEIYLAGQIRGETNEKRVAEALELLAQRGEIFNYYPCLTCGENDLLGWDFFVFPDPDWIIPLQVKSSKTGKEAYVAKYGLHTACVDVRDHVDVYTLAEEVLVALGISTKALREVVSEVEQEEKQELLSVFGCKLKEALSIED